MTRQRGRGSQLVSRSPTRGLKTTDGHRKVTVRVAQSRALTLARAAATLAEAGALLVPVVAGGAIGVARTRPARLGDADVVTISAIESAVARAAGRIRRIADDATAQAPSAVSDPASIWFGDLGAREVLTAVGCVLASPALTGGAKTCHGIAGTGATVTRATVTTGAARRVRRLTAANGGATEVLGRTDAESLLARSTTGCTVVAARSASGVIVGNVATAGAAAAQSGRTFLRAAAAIRIAVVEIDTLGAAAGFKSIAAADAVATRNVLVARHAAGSAVPLVIEQIDTAVTAAGESLAALTDLVDAAVIRTTAEPIGAALTNHAADPGGGLAL
jgi:hypothetical protein